MREMKDSGIEWIGEIPREWGISAIRYIISKHISGSWGNNPKQNLNDRICLRIADFNYPKIQFKDNTEFTLRNYSKSDIYNKTLKYGDLLIEKSGGGEKTPVGRTVVYRLNNNALFANFMDCIRLRESYSFEYAKYVFYSLYNNGVTKLYYNQTTGIQNLSMQKYFREVKVPIPLISHQNKIVNVLDKKISHIDSILSDLNKQIDILNQYKQSLITETVTKGLNPNVEMKDSGIEWIGKIPKSWKVFRIKDCCRIVRGGSPRPINNYLSDNVDDINWIRISDTIKGYKYIENTEQKITKSGISNSRIVHKGDLLLTNSMTFGQPYLLNINGCIHDGWLAFSEYKGIDKEYLFYLLMSELCKKQFMLTVSGAVVSNLNIDKVRATRILIPKYSEQKDIVDYLDSKCSKIDSIIEQKKKEIETIEQYKKSLIYEYVTGKKEVSVNE